jgi:hypothetical protein
LVGCPKDRAVAPKHDGGVGRKAGKIGLTGEVGQNDLSVTFD